MLLYFVIHAAKMPSNLQKSHLQNDRHNSPKQVGVLRELLVEKHGNLKTSNKHSIHMAVHFCSRSLWKERSCRQVIELDTIPNLCRM